MFPRVFSIFFSLIYEAQTEERRSVRSSFVSLFSYLSAVFLPLNPSICLSPLPSLCLSACLPVSDNSCVGIHLAGNSPAWLAVFLPDSREAESWRIRKQLLSCLSPAFCSQLPTQLLRGEGGMGGVQSDKRRTERGNDITRREMKGEKKSETESWCCSLSKKMLFLPSSLFLSLPVFLAVFMYSDKTTALWWWNRHADTTQQMKSVSWYLEAHTFCLSLSFHSSTGHTQSLSSQSFVLIFFSSPPACFYCDQRTRKHLISNATWQDRMYGLYKHICTISTEPLLTSFSLWGILLSRGFVTVDLLFNHTVVQRTHTLGLCCVADVCMNEFIIQNYS